MRLRTDGATIAGWKRGHELLGCLPWDDDPDMRLGYHEPEEDDQFDSLGRPQCHCGVAMEGHPPRRPCPHIAHNPDFADIEPAQPGDVWRLGGWSRGPNDPRPSLAGGYALACPLATCPEGVHRWWHAADCPAGSDSTKPCKHGPERTSCWEWTGSAEDGTLTASPSLWCMAERGGCGFHGWLRNGVLS